MPPILAGFLVQNTRKSRRDDWVGWVKVPQLNRKSWRRGWFEPQCNEVIERFIRTLKEQCLWLHRFETLAEARAIIAAFIRRYNEEWIIERLDYRTPAIARQELAAVA